MSVSASRLCQVNECVYQFAIVTFLYIIFSVLGMCRQIILCPSLSSSVLRTDNTGRFSGTSWPVHTREIQKLILTFSLVY